MMFSFISLPRTLLALVLLAASPALSVSISLPASSNDPFRAILVVHRARQPELPLCCLKPQPSIDPPDGPEDVLLSFEEWKSKQFQAHSHTLPTPQVRIEASEGEGASGSAHHEAPPLDPLTPAPDPFYPEDSLPAHFRVPLTDRFNYANMDCSARVHTSHRSAKSTSSILSSKKDKYMLSPCSTKNGEAQFVVVELCEDIRIDTVQLANFEFFSGVFKDFSVSVAKTYTATGEGWTLAGTYRAKNIRGVQSFHPPTSLRDFYRYIRIDFHSHYGHEYYCPVSLLRVYGLTHLEQWKWDMWEAESRQRLQEAGVHQPLIEANDVPSVEAPGEDLNAFMDKLESGPIHASTASSAAESASTAGQKTAQSSSSAHSQTRRKPPSSVVPEVPVSDAEQYSPPTTASSSVAEAMSSLASIMSPPPSASPTPSTDNHSHPHNADTPSVATASTQPMSLSITQQAAHASTPSALPPLQSPGSGESIYRTIMNRLTVLEANHTLYARYVEEQTAGVREVLRKLGEEVGRLEGIGRMQAQMYQRTVHEWERQRLRLELEHGELLSRVNYLTDEVVLEKRLGIAQLCLLLAVLVFMGLTRGAPSVEQPQAVLNRSTREWGARNLSLGSSREASWNPLRLRSRSPTVQRGPASARVEKATGTDMRIAFPTPVLATAAKPHPSATTFSPRNTPKASKSASTSASSLHKRSHTPSSFRTPTRSRPLVSVDPQTLPRALPITRSSSSIVSAHPSTRSAKRWARTAHLHEVKAVRERRSSGSGRRAEKDRDRENQDFADVFSVHTPSSSPSKHCDPLFPTKHRGPFSVLGALRSPLDDSTDADAWIDTDVEGSDFGSDFVASEGAVVLLNSPDVVERQ
ncbi:hypothetical protein HYDPIDRAFT_118855 [Hydnomerulius pinastri MD-312]|uniref:Unplaced genomic scaffold scaffold_65, whole genome shotgun sequence n=1 Tax=Hydnomerulius pinastri MD-312 TaxID=994086 RepID=A0A0C9V191_9AGAM|nr:hypothetical protein HYDPIDRAFT_118855 [Hydnomerulius pinastri MD-312]